MSCRFPITMSLCLALLIGVSAPAHADQHGEEILKLLDAAMTRAEDQHYVQEMVTKAPGKDEIKQVMDVRIKGTKYRRVEFLEPGDIKGMRIMRTIYFLPSVCSTTAVALLWLWIYQPGGWLDRVVLSLGFANSPDWMGDPRMIKPAIIFMGLWAAGGFNSVIYLAGLKQIPQHLYEAAQIDGASRFQRFRHITLPMLSPTIFFMTVIGAIGSFQIFEGIYVMTESAASGGPDRAAYTIIYHIYKNAFDYERMGYAAAMSFVLFIVIAAVTLLQFWGQKRWVHYE